MSPPVGDLYSAGFNRPSRAIRLERRQAKPAQQPRVSYAEEHLLDVWTRPLRRQDHRCQKWTESGDRQGGNSSLVPDPPGLVASHRGGDSDTGEQIPRQSSFRSHAAEHNDYQATESSADHLGHVEKVTSVSSLRNRRTSTRLRQVDRANIQCRLVARIGYRRRLSLRTTCDPQGTQVASGCHPGCLVRGRVPRKHEHEMILVEAVQEHVASGRD